jgi:chemotaxis protein methyltransferase CheR
MDDAACVEFLRWALRRLELRWEGFRRVRRQVCKRVDRRLRELGLEGVAEYRAYLESRPAEWGTLDGLCRISISRFYRDRAVFDALGDALLPEIAERLRAEGAREIRAWSAGCASGEEPYTLSLIWNRRLRERFPGLSLRIVATDADRALLERARRALYKASSLKELPLEWTEGEFEREGSMLRLKDEPRACVELREQDIRSELPEETFHLVLCRNLVFTYFDAPLRSRMVPRLTARLELGGFLVIGAHESLPPGCAGLRARPEARCIFERIP